MSAEGVIARDRGRQIAALLDLRKGTAGVPSRVLTRIRGHIRRAVDDPGQSLRDRLTPLAQHLGQRRGLPSVCIGLLESAWMIPDESAVEHDAAALVQAWLGQCRDTERAQIRDRVREEQWSPFAVTRRLAHLVREAEPVDEHELQVLGQPSRSYPDLRVSVCRRVLLHRQFDMVEVVLDHLVAITAADTPGPERDALDDLFRRLYRLDLDLGILRSIFDRYRARFDCYPVRGRLMRVLTQKASALAPLLPDWTRACGSPWEPSLRLLVQMITFDHAPAVDALTDLVLDARGVELDRACDALLAAAQGAAVRASRAGARLEVNVSLAATRLAESPRPEHSGLAADLRGIEWEAARVDAVVARLLRDQAGEAERRMVRGAMHRALPILLQAALDPARRLVERVRAVEALGEARAGRLRSAIVEGLWRIYLADTPWLVKRHVVLALGQQGRAPPEARTRLWQDFEALGDSPDGDKLARAIEYVWERIFPGLPPAARPTQARDES